MTTPRLLILLAVPALSLSGCAALNPGYIPCVDPCAIDLSVPATPGRPPETGNPYAYVQPASQVQFNAPSAVFVVFPKDTPFIDGNGDPIYWLNVDGQEKLRVRGADDKVCGYPGCKYMVIDAERPTRPVLDPYIIIDR